MTMRYHTVWIPVSTWVPLPGTAVEVYQGSTTPGVQLLQRFRLDDGVSSLTPSDGEGLIAFLRHIEGNMAGN
jgi:hypothetical protein